MDNTIVVTQLNAFKTYATSQYFFDFQTQDQIWELVELVQKVHTQWLPITILWSGTNCLFAFDHYPGLLIKTSLKGYSLHPNFLTTAAGEIVSPLIAKLRLPAFIPWVWLPGTFWGALVWNAGCFWFEAKDAIQEITLLDIFTGDKEIISPQKSDFSYRHSWRI
jgi:UDP-N-acetylmuramate dehydrogenase